MGDHRGGKDYVKRSPQYMHDCVLVRKKPQSHMEKKKKKKGSKKHRRPSGVAVCSQSTGHDAIISEKEKKVGSRKRESAPTNAGPELTISILIGKKGPRNITNNLGRSKPSKEERKEGEGR